MTKPTPKTADTRPFDALRAQIDQQPERRERVEELKHQMDKLELAQLRQSQQTTQRQLAQAMQVSQENISRIERQKDLYLSTLNDYITALGGHLQITATLPNHKTINLLK